MKIVEMTFWRSTKVFWSFIWRTWVLMMPLMILLSLSMALLIKLTMPKDGAPPSSAFFLLFPAWLIIMVMMFAIQIFALRWALKARWSDFRLAAIAPPEETLEEMIKTNL